MFWTLKRVLTWLLVLVVVATIVSYAYYQSRGLIAGPTISVTTPENGLTTKTSLINVRGTVARVKDLTLDGRDIFVDLSGRFSEELLLLPGYNIIELTAKDAQGRETKKVLEVVYDAPPPVTASTTATSTGVM